MRESGIRWSLLLSIFDSRVHRMAKAIAKKRIRDAELGLCNSSSTEPPRILPFGSRQYAYQTAHGLPWTVLLQRINSPEWMLAVVIREAIRQKVAPCPGLEFAVSGTNASCRDLPDQLTQLTYLWWRLDKYFGINKKNACLFTDDILNHALLIAEPVMG